jgi:trypsin-like peptidase
MPVVGGIENIFRTVCAVARKRATPTASNVGHDICGTAFALAPRLFMTAAHVLDGPRAEFSLCTKMSEGSGLKAWPVVDWELLTDIDVALVECELPGAAMYPWHARELDMLTDVLAMGYPFAIDEVDLFGRARALKGYVVCADTAGASELKGRPRIYELSFQSPRGLSGAPLLVPTVRGLEVAGVMLKNRSTSLSLPKMSQTTTERVGTETAHTIVETQEVVHFGVAAQIGSIGRLEDTRLLKKILAMNSNASRLSQRRT